MKNSIKTLVIAGVLSVFASAAFAVPSTSTGSVAVDTATMNSISVTAPAIVPVYSVVTPTSTVTGTLAWTNLGTLVTLTNTTSNTWVKVSSPTTPATFVPAN